MMLEARRRIFNMKFMKKAVAPSRRAVVFQYVDAPGKSVAVAGSFNDWQPDKVLSDKKGDGHYSCRVMLYPGEYQYIYVAEDYSYLVYHSAVYGAIRWGDDFSHFKSFDHNGDSDPFSWHIAFIKNIFKAIKTALQLIFKGIAV